MRKPDVSRGQNVHTCINVYGGLQYSANRSFALQTIGFVFFLSLPPQRRLMCFWVVCDGGTAVSMSTWWNVSRDSKMGAQSTKVVEETLFLHFSSLHFISTVVSAFFLLLIWKKCYFTAVVSYFCKLFANQNAMYSRYGLYFRFTALQTVCKYESIKWKKVSVWGCSVFVLV